MSEFRSEANLIVISDGIQLLLQNIQTVFIQKQKFEFVHKPTRAHFQYSGEMNCIIRTWKDTDRLLNHLTNWILFLLSSYWPHAVLMLCQSKSHCCDVLPFGQLTQTRYMCGFIFYSIKMEISTTVKNSLFHCSCKETHKSNNVGWISVFYSGWWKSYLDSKKCQLAC